MMNHQRRDSSSQQSMLRKQVHAVNCDLEKFNPKSQMQTHKAGSTHNVRSSTDENDEEKQEEQDGDILNIYIRFVDSTVLY